MNLRDLRKQNKKTQAELGQELGITGQAIANYENGTRTPSILFALKYAKALGVSIDIFAKCYEKDDYLSG